MDIISANNSSRVSRVRRRHCEYQEDVEKQLNEWICNGWNLDDFFINIVYVGRGGDSFYTIFYDQRLDYENEELDTNL